MSPTVPFPFFVGCGRSGTTLLRAMFSMHPDLAVVHESRFITATLENAGSYQAGGHFDVDHFCREVLENPSVSSRVSAWQIDNAALRRAVMEARPADVPDAVRAMYRAYARAHGKARYADKTPRYVNDVAKIGLAFPESRFVHVIRDGRDVALAWRDVAFGARGVFEAAHLWRAKVQRARRDGAALGPTRYLEVRYEDLVDSPEATVRRICDFIELPFHPALLEHHAHPEDLFDELDEQGHHASLRLPITSGLRQWRVQMKPNEIRRFEAVAGGVLTDLGYEVVGGGRFAPLYRPLSRIGYVFGRARVKVARRAGARS